MFRRVLTFAALLAVALLRASSLVAQAARPQVIQGRVTTDSGAVIAGADVIVTVAPTAESITGKADASGDYRIVIAAPTGEYILYIGALGRKPFRQRVTIAAKDSVATVNAKLASSITAVAAVRVQARKVRPARSLGGDGGFGDATDKVSDGVTGALPPDLQGNLDAMAAFIPGLSVGMGTSAFGLGPDANQTTLNGLAFGGSDLPRDARTTTRFRTSPWDPTIGGFSGVQTATSLSSGNNLASRHAHITFDAPALQFSDPVATRLGQKYYNLSLDEGGAGAYQLDDWYYNFGAHFARQTASVASLGDLDPDALERAGVSPDSAARLSQLLNGFGIPLGLNGASTSRTTTTGSFVERIDHWTPQPNRPPDPITAFTVFGRYSQSESQSLSPTLALSAAGKTSSGLAGIQGLYSRFFGKDDDYVSETTSGLSVSSTRGTPYLELPGGSVLILSDAGLGSLGFGGNSALATDARTWTWETINQTNFLAAGRATLPMKVYLQSRFDGFSQSLAANRLGRFSYASLGDLAANRPSSYSRTLNAPDRSGGEWIGAAAVGGNWVSSGFTLTGGVRADANAFTAAPRANDDVGRLFGVPNDHAPNSVDLSPRLGFTWKVGQGGNSVSFTPVSQIYRGGGQLRGGIGKFRSILPSTLLADATSYTGLPGSVQQLSCIGAAAPTPNWNAYSADPSTIPSTCVGGASTFADSARTVTLFDRGYTPAESWRANLGWTSPYLLKTYFSIDASYSLNLHQPGTIDLNFAGTPRFTLQTEGNRPVFVDPASIVPSTGAISSVDARLNAGYARVSDRVSDLRSTAGQLALYAIPNIPFGAGTIIIGYTYSDARAQARGFDASTAADPRSVDWAPSSFTPRHQGTLQLGKVFFGGSVAATGALRASSGFTFTPLVAGDVNGDGSSNDRAFIFTGAAAGDTAVTNGLSALRQHGSAAARDCLAKQAGGIAGRNSCVGPWFTTMNANITFLKVPRAKDATVAISFANLPGALDQLLHGDNGLRGWGTVPFPDQTLYQTRGFDPAARRFIYEVNPRFGASDPSTTTRRSPFRVSLDVQLTLGRSYQEQLVEQLLRVRPGLVGTRASADSVKARYLRSTFTNIYSLILQRFTDSLALSRAQSEALQARQTLLKARVDTIFTSLALDLVALPMDFSPREAIKRVAIAEDAMWAVIYGERSFLTETFTPGQIRLLPSPIHSIVSTPGFKGRFLYSGYY